MGRVYRSLDSYSGSACPLSQGPCPLPICILLREKELETAQSCGRLRELLWEKGRSRLSGWDRKGKCRKSEMLRTVTYGLTFSYKVLVPLNQLANESLSHEYPSEGVALGDGQKALSSQRSWIKYNQHVVAEMLEGDPETRKM